MKQFIIMLMLCCTALLSRGQSNTTGKAIFDCESQCQMQYHACVIMGAQNCLAEYFGCMAACPPPDEQVIHNKALLSASYVEQGCEQRCLTQYQWFLLECSYLTFPNQCVFQAQIEYFICLVTCAADPE